MVAVAIWVSPARLRIGEARHHVWNIVPATSCCTSLPLASVIREAQRIGALPGSFKANAGLSALPIPQATPIGFEFKVQLLDNFVGANLLGIVHHSNFGGDTNEHAPIKMLKFLRHS